MHKRMLFKMDHRAFTIRFITLVLVALQCSVQGLYFSIAKRTPQAFSGFAEAELPFRVFIRREFNMMALDFPYLSNGHCVKDNVFEHCSVGNASHSVKLSNPSKGNLPLVRNRCARYVEQAEVKMMWHNGLCTSAENCRLNCDAEFSQHYRHFTNLSKPVVFKEDSTLKLWCYKGQELYLERCGYNPFFKKVTLKCFRHNCVSRYPLEKKPTPDPVHTIQLLRYNQIVMANVIRPDFYVDFPGYSFNFSHCAII
eukprot:scpid103841/ scgid20059/ 